jgi:hypothetical protein
MLMKRQNTTGFIFLFMMILATALSASHVQAQNTQNKSSADTYSSKELVDSGHRFFGNVSRSLALAIESATSKWGNPNAYILGQEGSAAFVGGLRYGEGSLHTKTRGQTKVFWQGPSLGVDFGGDGARTMMLVYNLSNTSLIFQRFGGVNGSAYLIGGFGVTALTADNIVVVPIRSGVGARLGVNIGYLKFTPSPSWNPF